MRLRRLLLRAAMLAGATGLLLGALALTRPWFRNWGAMAEEIHRRATRGRDRLHRPRPKHTGDHHRCPRGAGLGLAGPDRTGPRWLSQLRAARRHGRGRDGEPALPGPGASAVEARGQAVDGAAAQVRRRRPRGVDGPETGAGAGVRDPPDRDSSDAIRWTAAGRSWCSRKAIGRGSSFAAGRPGACHRWPGPSPPLLSTRSIS